MMDGEITVGLWESSGGTKVVALDFADQDTSMVLVLPPEGSGPSEEHSRRVNLPDYFFPISRLVRDSAEAG